MLVCLKSLSLVPNVKSPKPAKVKKPTTPLLRSVCCESLTFLLEKVYW